MNGQFEEVLGGKPKGDAYISKYIPELNVSIFPKQEDDIVARWMSTTSDQGVPGRAAERCR